MCGSARPGVAAGEVSVKRLVYNSLRARIAGMPRKAAAQSADGARTGGFSTVFSTGVENFGERPNEHAPNPDPDRFPRRGSKTRGRRLTQSVAPASTKAKSNTRRAPWRIDTLGIGSLTLPVHFTDPDQQEWLGFKVARRQLHTGSTDEGKTHISAEHAPQSPCARISRSDEYQERASRVKAPARQGPKTAHGQLQVERSGV